MAKSKLIVPIIIALAFKSATTFSQNAGGNGLLWEIYGNGLKEKSYIFGTMHLIPEKEFFIPKTLQEKLLTTKVLATEIEMDIPLLKQVSLAKKMILPNEKSIKDFMNPEDYKKLETYCKDSVKLSDKKIAQYFRLKPYVATSMLVKDMIGDFKTYDIEIEKLASGKKIKNVGLETIDDQLSIFDSIPIEKQLEELNGDLNLMKDYRELLLLYKTGNVDEMAAQATKELDGEKLLFSRNKKWVPILDKLVKENATFIAVGAAHLGGETGMINQLRKLGYQLKSLE
jgi:uncharacterized protein YbaP (TraB family)